MTEIGMIRQVREKHFQGIGPSLLDVTPVGPVRVGLSYAEFGRSDRGLKRFGFLSPWVGEW